MYQVLLGTYSTILHVSILSGRSFKNNTNNNGPRKDPCGTPPYISALPEMVPM